MLRRSKLIWLFGTATLLTSGPGAASSPMGYNPWVSLSAFASPNSAKPLVNRPACRTREQVTRARAEQRAGKLPFCILSDDPGVSSVVGSSTAAGARSIGTLPLVLGLSTFLGMVAMPLSMYASDKDLRPVSPE